MSTDSKRLRIGAVGRYATGPPVGHPEVARRICHRAIGDEPGRSEVEPGLGGPRRPPGPGVEGVAFDAPSGRVGEIGDASVRCKGDGIGDGDAVMEPADLTAPVAVESPRPPVPPTSPLSRSRSRPMGRPARRSTGSPGCPPRAGRGLRACRSRCRNAEDGSPRRSAACCHPPSPQRRHARRIASAACRRPRGSADGR